ncbi:MAG: HAMP domain-containing histidine kinase [Porphyrobacter sp.]|nr:HAMP domain-containing histidine kinase [Porphyrobacter sp.]
MISGLKALVARHWPVLHLRTILFGTLLFVAALPGFGAIFLRVYENALVRRTEAELVAQSAALSAAAALLWSEAATGNQVLPPAVRSIAPVRYHDRPPEIDLRSSPILPSRPAAGASDVRPDQAALSVAHRIAPVFNEAKQTTLASMILLDRHGLVLNGNEAGRSLAMLPEVRGALAGRASTVLRQNNQYRARYALEWLSRAANVRLHHARPIRVNGEVVGVLLVSRSPRALFRGIYEDRGKIAFGVIAIFGLLIMVSAVLSRAIVRPIEGLSRATRDLASGRRSLPHRPSLQVVEIRQLFDDFDHMAESIEKRSRYLRDFASSVSHEFKTPLTGIAGAIELLQDHRADIAPRDRDRFLANIAADAERLSQLVRRLMELARADVLVGDGNATSDAASVLASVADAFRNDDLAIEVSAPQDGPALKLDGSALEAVVTTLAENARQAGASKLEISLRHQGDEVEIDLVDNGPGVAPADRERIFDPFFTSKREAGGTGLGLAIARSLLHAYRGTLVLVPSASGAHFRITCLAKHTA